MPERTTHDCGTLSLDENKEYLIFIKDNSGRPVTGAQCEFYKPFQGLVMTKQSDLNGTIRITGKELGVDLDIHIILLRVRAAGLGDYLIECEEKERLPEEIVLKPAGFIPIQIVDSKTGFGIPDVRLILWLRYNIYKSELFEHLFISTNSDGLAEIPKLSGINNLNVNINFIAEGYLCTENLYYSLDRIPIKILLDPVEKYIPIQVVDQPTQRPMSDLVVKIKYFNDTVADEKGFFKLPVKSNTTSFITIETEGYDTINTSYREDPKTQSFNSHKRKSELIDVGGFYRLELLPKNGSKANIMVTVRNEIGLPVAEAWVRVSYRTKKRTIDSDSRTNSEGIVKRDDLYLLPKSEVNIYIDRTGYVPYHYNFTFFPTEEWIKIDAILTEGIYFDKIRVVDCNGDYAERVTIQAILDMEDGSKVTLRGGTDKNGLCAFDFPFFNQGEIYISYKVDRSMMSNKRKITFDDILSGKEIVVTAEQLLINSSFIKGYVCDLEGRPLEGASVRANLVGDSNRLHGSFSINNKTKTGKDGLFRLDAYKNQLYDLSIHLTKNNLFWYPKNEFTSISDGTDLLVTLVQRAVVEVDYEEYLKKSKRAIRLSLVSETGEIIDPIMTTGYNKIKKRFQGIPPGKMRAEYEDEDGKIYYSPYFEVKEGEYVKITFEALE